MTISRNAPCPCGSGKKYKRCCLPRQSVPGKTGFALPASRVLETEPASFWKRWLPVVILTVTVASLYFNTLDGSFLFDDRSAILENLRIRRFWPLGTLLAGMTRPIIELSLAMNYALGGLDPRGYHVFNIIVHAMATLTLYGCIRRTLLMPRLAQRFASASRMLALSIALLWAVHPLQTQSVAYIIQRAESLMGFFYLFTLYAVIRSADSRSSGLWKGVAIAACAAGIATKAIMVTAPLMIWLYDRTFLSGSFLGALKKRKTLYAGLAATWGMLAALLMLAPAIAPEETTAGFSLTIITPLQYAQTQFAVILHYLRLVVWPHPLIADYHWRPVEQISQVLPQAITIGLLLAGTFWALRKRPALGFAAAWFFVILAPSSSIIPIADVAFEYRMYLPLAGLLTLGVLGAHAALSGLRRARMITTVLLTVCLAILGTLTIRRNQDYASELALWGDTAKKQPNNPRAQNNYGYALAQEQRNEEALHHLMLAFRIQPENEEIHNNLGLALARLNRTNEAIAHYEESLRLNPEYGNAYSNYGLLLVKLGRVEEAVPKYEEAIRFREDFFIAHNNLGGALFRLGRYEEAKEHYRKSISINPDYAEAHQNFALSLTQSSHHEEAAVHYQWALQLKPNYPDAHSNFGVSLYQQGKLTEAAGHFRAALQLNPDLREARNNLNRVLQELSAPESN